MVTAVSMYQSDDAGNAVPLDDVGGLDQFHGGDWPVDVWIDYMKPATANLPGDDFPWKVESNRKVHNNAPTPAPSASGYRVVVESDNGLNLRAQPNAGSEVLYVLPYGMVLTVLGEGENGFLYVQWGGYTGYVSGDYVTPFGAQ